MFALGAAVAMVLSLVALVLLGREALAERFPAAVGVVCEVLGCRMPVNPNFELVRVVTREVQSPTRQALHLDVVYRALNTGARDPLIDVVVFDEREIRAHAVVQVGDPRVIAPDVRVATIALPVDSIGDDVGFEVTLR